MASFKSSTLRTDMSLLQEFPLENEDHFDELHFIHDAQQHSWRIDQILKKNVTNDPMEPLHEITVDKSKLALSDEILKEPTITNKWMKKFEKEIAEQFKIQSLMNEIQEDELKMELSEEERVNSESVSKEDLEEDSSQMVAIHSPLQATNTAFQEMLQKSNPIPITHKNVNTFLKPSWNELQSMPIEEILDDVDLSTDTDMNRTLLASKITFLEMQLAELETQKLALETAIDRLKQEIQINEECETIEERTELKILKHPIMNSESDEDDDEDLLVEDEDSGALVIHPDDDDDDLSVNEEDSVTTVDTIDSERESSHVHQSLAYKIICKKQKLNEEMSRIKEQWKRYKLVLQEYRREKLANIHINATHSMKSPHTSRWLEETKKIENKVAEELATIKSNVDDLIHEREFLFDHLQFAETQTQYCHEILKQLIEILKGKQEVPTGVHLSVSRALQLYSQLKEIAEQDALDISFLKDFLAQHEGIFGITIPDFQVDGA